MYLQYKKEDEPIVNIIYSPFHEMICSLHVLAVPSHHMPRLNWSKKILDKMTDDERDDINFFDKASSQFIGMLSFINVESTWDYSITDTLSYIEHMSINEFYHHFMNEKLTPKIIDQTLLYHTYPEGINQETKVMLMEPEVYKNKFIGFLENYYHNYFVRDLSFSEPIYLRHLKHQFNVAQSMDIYEYINGLHPRIENSQDKINFHKYKLFEVYKNELKQIQIYVTSFGMPHLLIGFGMDYITLVTPAYITAYDGIQTPEDTLKILKSISDETRMQMIKLMYNGPKSTQKLAELLGITEAGISKHLKILHQSGIVTKERDGNYMNYHLNINVIDSLVLMMYEYIS